RPKRLKKRQTGRVGAVEAEFFNGLLARHFHSGLAQRQHGRRLAARRALEHFGSTRAAPGEKAGQRPWRQR
ncbi:hypothetical protein, partial [Pseudomonas aeruginosa]|uniref:hypothetical protein n=1 Tax=Pseudomonas aeruginosa TaxID=287 RepID=UPI001C10E992